MSARSERIPTILLLEPDNETRRLLVENLRDRGYQVFVVIDEQNAIEWLDRDREKHPDLILINQFNVSLEECLATIAHIYRQTGLSQQIPTAIIAERYQPDLEGTEEKFDDNIYVIYLENAQQLFDLLDRFRSR